MPNQKNKDIVNKLKDKLVEARSVVIAEYQGLKANEINDLRDKMSEFDTEMSVQRNTLLKIALKEQDKLPQELETALEGPVAAFIAHNDAIAYLKTLFEFSSEKEALKIKAGLIDGVYANAAQVKVYSDLPAKDVLIAQVVGAMKSPLSGIVNVLGGTHRKLVYALAAIADKKEVS